jgi:xylulokinase
LDAGTSSIKASLLDVETGACVASAQHPAEEMPVAALQPGWAEQDPEAWWGSMVQAVREACRQGEVASHRIRAIGIAYQMHGLVCLDCDGRVLRPSIIWCDSRSVETGERAFQTIGPDWCLSHLLNSPGNFTASKLRWVKDNEPDVYAQIDTILLPGDYLAYRMTGDLCTTVSGLSEGMFWDFPAHEPARALLDGMEISPDLLADIVPTFGAQGELNAEAAGRLGLNIGTPVTYRAGDQPNNALSLNVLEQGEVAATAGTSGVIYGVSDAIQYDPQSRVNTFAHVNHKKERTRLGVTLCVNGTGIAYAWLRRLMGPEMDYVEMNALAEQAPIGADGLSVMPFGNGAERLLNSRDVGASVHGLQFNRHQPGHLCRAVQEGIVFSLHYGLDVMKSIGVKPEVIRAGKANLFLSSVFRKTLAALTGARIELYETDGSLGAARGAAFGAGLYGSLKEACESLQCREIVTPDAAWKEPCAEAYGRWVGPDGPAGPGVEHGR